jgi:hypothetical protein
MYVWSKRELRCGRNDTGSKWRAHLMHHCRGSVRKVDSVIARRSVGAHAAGKYGAGAALTIHPFG